MIDQPDGWLGGTVQLDWPILSNLRLDPFERMQFAEGQHGLVLLRVRTSSCTNSGASSSCSRKSANTRRRFIEFPPMQKGASFNLEAVKAEIEERVKAMKGKME